MFYFEYPTVDTTLYEGTVSSAINTGLDEILEIDKKVNDAGTEVDVSRVFIKFSYNYISKSSCLLNCTCNHIYLSFHTTYL